MVSHYPPLSISIYTKLFLYFCLVVCNSSIFATEKFSEINRALFDSPHMKGISVPGTINYQYIKTDSKEGKRLDSISVEVSNIKPDGRTDQSYDFFTDKYKRPYLQRSGILGNAIFMLFLEWDIHELQRQTEGSWRHFQRRIRWAMAQDPKSQDVELTLINGEKVQGVQYRIQPYAEDKDSQRYGEQLNKYYIFTLSDEIPGTIYEIRTIVPKFKNWKEGDTIISEERMTFTSYDSNSS